MRFARNLRRLDSAFASSTDHVSSALRILILSLLLAGCEDRVVPTTQSTEPSTHQATSQKAMVPIPNHSPLIRVRLHHITQGEVVVGTTDQQSSIRLGGESITMNGDVHISRRDGLWHVSNVKLPKSMAKSDMLEFHSASPIHLSCEDHRTYPGSLRLVSNKDDAFDVINDVNIEEYIPGVLAGELYEGWHDPTFESQAIAARSYALVRAHERARHAWDLTDTPSSQVYVGIPTWPQAARCANATHGQILTYQSSVVPGYFSSCCGGLAATARDAVGPNPINAVPPLDGHGQPSHCTDAPRYRWTLTWPAEQVSAALRAWGRKQKNKDLSSIGSLTSMTPIDNNAHGRPTRVELIDHQGRHASVRCVDLPFILSQYGLKAPSSGWLGATRHGDTMEVHGRGFGHGVGLCQYGAQSMASNGSSTSEIIDFYYPGAMITTGW